MDNPFHVKPIEDVKNTQHTINRNLNQIKTDIICIKADISIIKDYIKLQKKKEEEISKGWFWG
jgi:uncharacterized protein (UPF0335 family)